MNFIPWQNSITQVRNSVLSTAGVNSWRWSSVNYLVEKAWEISPIISRPNIPNCTILESRKLPEQRLQEWMKNSPVLSTNHFFINFWADVTRLRRAINFHSKTKCIFLIRQILTYACLVFPWAKFPLWWVHILFFQVSLSKSLRPGCPRSLRGGVVSPEKC